MTSATAGSGRSLGCVALAISTGRPLWLPGALLRSHGYAWVGHFVFEKNKPASFKRPPYEPRPRAGSSLELAPRLIAIESWLLPPTPGSRTSSASSRRSTCRSAAGTATPASS